MTYIFCCHWPHATVLTPDRNRIIEYFMFRFELCPMCENIRARVLGRIEEYLNVPVVILYFTVIEKYVPLKIDRNICQNSVIIFQNNVIIMPQHVVCVVFYMHCLNLHRETFLISSFSKVPITVTTLIGSCFLVWLCFHAVYFLSKPWYNAAYNIYICALFSEIPPVSP